MMMAYVLIGGIIAFGLLVLVHEFGHFIVAKACGVGVLEFSIGFGRTVVKRKIGETVYSLRLIPLGGYVRMLGDDPHLLQPEQGPSRAGDGKADEPEDPTESISELLEPLDPSLEAERAELLKDRSRWFLTKSIWQKAAIVLAGPLFNLIFAVLLAFAIFVIYGKAADSSNKAIVGVVHPDTPAAKAGLKRKDRILSINGERMGSWDTLSETIKGSDGAPLKLEVERAGESGVSEVLNLEIVPTYDNDEIDYLLGDGTKPKKKTPRIGISPEFEREPAGIWEAATLAPYHVWVTSKLTVVGLWGLVTGQLAAKHVRGPIFIFGEAGRSAKRGGLDFLNFMLTFSVALAIFNLLPVPVLDGGHLLFFTIEALRGKPLDVRVQAIANQVGFVLLIGLMIFAFSNDIFRPPVMGG